MTYRRLKADRIFDGKEMIEGNLLILHEDGTVDDIIADDGGEAEQFNGILSPGFINCHCHLELSHLKNKVAPGEGMVQFLIDIVYARKNSDEGKLDTIRKAEKKVWENGTNGIADICNTTDTLELKKNSHARWYNLVEVINFYDSSLDKQLHGFRTVLERFEINNMAAALTPHAPYSISPATYDAINEMTKGKIISIHNQESKAENDLFLTGESDFLRLYSEFADGRSPFDVTGKSSLQTWLPHFTNGQTILLVHNTYISEDDIVFAKDHAKKHGLQLIYCICPNANLYIESRMPPVDMLMEHGCFITLGTDSYSSNHDLSIGEEIKTVFKFFPEVSLTTLLQWATSNGANALRWNDLGRFENGTRPGVILFDPIDFSATRII